MRLIDLNPNWIGSGGDGVFDKDHLPVPRREGIAIMFNCPCGDTEDFICVHLDPPLDGGSVDSKRAWKREGDSFENLTLTPSIQKLDGCKWHGFVTNGEIVTV